LSVTFVGRYHAIYSQTYKLEVDKSKYNLHLNDARMSTDAQQRWMTTSQPTFAAEPQYYLYAAENSDAWDMTSMTLSVSA